MPLFTMICTLCTLFWTEHFEDQLSQAGLFFGQFFVLFALLVVGFGFRAYGLGQGGRAAVYLLLKHFKQFQFRQSNHTLRFIGRLLAWARSFFAGISGGIGLIFGRFGL